MQKKRRTRIEKIITIITIIIIALTIAILIFARTSNNKEENINPETSTAGTSSSSINTNTNTNPQVKYSPLTPAEIEKITNAILSSEFIKSIPEKDPISLTFFKFENGERIWQNGFLIGKNQLLTSGAPGINLILHSKYISQLNSSNLCDIIQQANKNKDLGSQSDYSTMNLLMKYSGMLKYRDCFGI